MSELASALIADRFAGWWHLMEWALPAFCLLLALTAARSLIPWQPSFQHTVIQSLADGVRWLGRPVVLAILVALLIASLGDSWRLALIIDPESWLRLLMLAVSLLLTLELALLRFQGLSWARVAMIAVISVELGVGGLAFLSFVVTPWGGV